MLQHTAAGVRAAAAGAVGNLARHSSAFYATIAAERLLPRIIELCSDADAGVRKFACFAVGLLGECSPVTLIRQGKGTYSCGDVLGKL